MVLYFSGTGNSRRVAERLGEKLNEDVFPLVRFIETDSVCILKEHEALGIVFPVYSWGPPIVVLDALTRLQTCRVPDFIYFVCTCGDDVGKTADILKNAIAHKGWECEAGFSVMMPNTYVCLPGFDVDSERLANLKLCNMKERIAFIAKCITERKAVFDCHEGMFPHVKSYLIRPLFNRFLISPKRFRVTNNCISCGKCVQVCPLHNIRLDGYPVWGKHCTMCLACYHHCPEHAVEYSLWSKGKGQFALKEERG